MGKTTSLLFWPRPKNNPYSYSHLLGTGLHLTVTKFIPIPRFKQHEWLLHCHDNSGKRKRRKIFQDSGPLLSIDCFFMVMLVLLLGILAYDYWKILQQVYENKHLGLENRQLKEQVQLFQMKMNSLGDDLRRINTFERKLRVIKLTKQKLIYIQTLQAKTMKRTYSLSKDSLILSSTSKGLKTSKNISS